MLSDGSYHLKHDVWNIQQTQNHILLFFFSTPKIPTKHIHIHSFQFQWLYFQLQQHKHYYYAYTHSSSSSHVHSLGTNLSLTQQNKKYFAMFSPPSTQPFHGKHSSPMISVSPPHKALFATMNKTNHKKHTLLNSTSVTFPMKYQPHLVPLTPFSTQLSSALSLTFYKCFSNTQNIINLSFPSFPSSL